VLETHGHGLNTDLTLFYNSLQAIYQDSLEFYQRLNGVPDSVIAEYWCRKPCW
jgi:hypothetical protein